MRALTALLLVTLAAGSQAYVYTCNEISNTLLPKDLRIPSKYACVVLQDLLSPDTEWLSSTVIWDEASGNQYSLADIASIPSQPCISGEGPWRVVTPTPSSIDCTYEITLLFSSVPTNLVVIQPHSYEYIRGPGSDLTFVSPRGGISLNWHTQGEVTGNEQITFYTGVGSGPEEDLYPIGSLTTNDMAEGRDTDIFDPVVTVKIPSTISIEIGYDTFADKALNVFGFPGYSVNVMSSGQATTFQEQNTMKVVQASYGRRASVHVTASITLDPSSEHTLKLQAYCGSDVCGEKIVKQSTTVDWLLNAEKFRVNYITGLSPSQIGKNGDNIFISVVSSKARCEDDRQLQLGDHCYWSSDGYATFSDAEADCVSKGGHLASIHNEDTNTFVEQLAYGAPIGVFIGMKNDGNQYKWTDGSVADYNNGNLDSFGGDCVIMGTVTGSWSNSDCDFAFKYICEKNAN